MTNATTPVVAGLFEADAEGAHLIGTRCTACGAAYFPVAYSCRNPACEAKAVRTERLPRTGTLYSYTVQHYRPPPLFRMEPWAPYALGLVELEPGLRVMGMMTGIEPEALRIGLAVEVVLEPLAQDAQGGAVLTYKFAPRSPALEGPGA